MKTRIITLLLLILTVHFTFGQKKKNPRDISEAITILNTDCPNSLKSIIKRTPNDSLIYLCYPFYVGYKTMYNWTKRDNGIKKYLIEKGVSSYQFQQIVILKAFKMSLLGEQCDEKTLLQPYQAIESKWAKEDIIRFTSDSLRDIYIPKDLNDCLRQLDTYWRDSTRMQMKQLTEEEFLRRADMIIGIWIRSDWQLLEGSRLSKYFNEMGVAHPENMSEIILISYHRSLTGKNIRLEEQIRYYQDYWKNVKEYKRKK